jgi:hypothetical protein
MTGGGQAPGAASPANAMPFIFPGLVALGALAAVPVVIHLLNKQRYRRVRWAAMPFLLESIRLDAKRIKYRDLILMLLRTLACLFVALAVARPVTTVIAGSKGGNRWPIVVLDTSLSMGANDGAVSLLDRAKNEAVTLVRGLEPGTEMALIEGSKPARLVIGRSKDPKIVESAIEEFVARDTAFDVAGAIRTASSLAGEIGYGAGIDLVIVTDLQASTWRRDARTIADAVRKFGRDVRVCVIPVGNRLHANLAVTELHCDTPWIARGQPVALRADVSNGGAEPAEKVLVDLFLDDHKVSSKVIARLDPGKVESTSFVITPEELGYHVVSAVVNGVRSRLPDDDTRRIVLRVTAGVATLLVDGEPGARFGEGETDYIDALLNPDSLPGAAMGEDEERTGFSIRRVRADEFVPAHLQRKEVAVLANLSGIEMPMAVALRERVKEGMGLLIFLGDRVAPGSYNQLVGEFAAGGLGLLPAELGELIDTTEAKRSLYCSADDLSHPWMAMFRMAENRPLLLAPVHKAYELKPVKAEGVRTVAVYGNGVPFAVERRIGRGRVALFGTSADPEWNELFRNPLGPILVRRAIGSMIPGSDVQRTRSVGENIEVPLRPEEGSAPLRLTLPDDKVQEVQADRVGDQFVFSLGQREEAGVYRLDIAGGEGRQEVLALNVEGAESFLEPVDAADISQLFPDKEVTVLAGDGADGTANALFKRAFGRELWWPVLLLAFVAFIAEIALARMFTPSLSGLSELPKAIEQTLRRAPGADLSDAGKRGRP